MLSEEKKSWLASVLKVPVERMEPMDMIPRAKAEKYKDEEKKSGWRGKTKEQQEATHIVTHHFDDKEREDNTVSFEEGRAMMPEGDFAKGGQNYAIDPKTGEMVLGGGKGAILRNMNEDGTPTDKTETVNLTQAQIRANKDPKGKRAEIYHHSSMLKGEDVGGAGVVTFGPGGKIKTIDNDSGHYTPKFVQLLQTVEHLMKQGALLDQTLVDHEGNKVAPSSPAYKLYDKVQPMLAALPKDRDRIAELLHKLEAPGITTAQVVKLSGAGDKIVARIETVQKAMTVLGKMGIGPSMKIDKDVKVGFLSTDTETDGLGFRLGATRKDLDVDEFLMGTGSTGTKANPSRGSLEEGDTEEETGDEDKVDVTNYMVENYNLKPTTDGYDKLDSLRGDKLDDSGDKGGSPNLENYDSVESVRAGAPKVSHREGGAKSDMLDELKDVVAKRRPERGKDKGSVITGVAPEVNPEEWLKEVQGLSDALDELEEEEDEEDEDDSFDDLDLSDDEDEDLGVSGGATLGSVTYETKLDKKGNVIKVDTPLGKSPLRDDDGDDLDPFPEEQKGGSSHNYDEPSLRGNSSGKDDKKGKKKPKNKVGDNPYLTSNFEEESPYKDSFVKTQNFEDD